MNNVSAFLFPLLACLGAWLCAGTAFATPEQTLPEKTPTSVTPSLASSFVDRALASGLAERKEWRRLVHYKRGLIGWESEADGTNFFVAPDGKKNPRAELEATIRGFFTPEKRKLIGKTQPAQSVQCQFPARFHWLDKELGLSTSVPKLECPEWVDFRTRSATKSVTLVFSSFYVANPSSTFGHSLLRLNKSTGSDGSEHHQLLDYGVNYAAVATTGNGLLYAMMGLAGLFEGHFTSLPYYYKVREYADFQSRDLWEYDFDLTQEETDQVVAHIWELGSTYFDYYYLTENCSYHMLTLIDAAAPRLSLTERMPYFVIPTDTVKAAYDEPGLVKKANFRASIHSQFNARLARLEGTEEKELHEIISREGDDGATDNRQLLAASSLSEDAKARVLDAYIDYFDLNHARALVDKVPDKVARKQSLLIARSKLPVSQALSFDPPPTASPHLAHDSARASLARISNDSKGGATDLGFRFAFHDLIDPPEGLPGNASIEIGNFVMRYWDETKRIQLEDFALFGVGTYQPLGPYAKKASWRVRSGAHRVDDQRCTDCEALYFRGAYGYSANLATNGPLTYLLGEATFETSPAFELERLTTTVGPVLGLRFRLQPWMTLLAEGRYIRTVNQPIFEDRQLETHLRFYPRAQNVEWGIDARALFKRAGREVTVGLVHYF